MWQLKIAAIILVCACVQQTLARPGYLHGAEVLPTYEHIEYAPTVVGHTLHTIPTAVSHQSQTIVHEKRPYLRPIVEHTPLVHAYHAPATTVALPLSYSSVAYGGGLYGGHGSGLYGGHGSGLYGGPGSGLYGGHGSGLYGSHGWDNGLGTAYGNGWSAGWPLR